MLDKKTEMMLSAASTLTEEDLDQLRATAPIRSSSVRLPESPKADPLEADAAEQDAAVSTEVSNSSGLPQGERERMRTRASKISTACVGREREKHEWWPVGTELVGKMGSENFTAMVVENAQVKSGRSILITSGAASGKVCITPTRAAMEATESYRQANNLGRGGGVTNGWEFWKART